MAEMYVQGVSTGKVAAITQKLRGQEMTTAGSAGPLRRRMPSGRGGGHDRWWDPLPGPRPRYEKVRHGGQVVSSAVLVAIGIEPDGERSGWASPSRCRGPRPTGGTSRGSLQARGLHGVRLVASDAHAGLRPALDARLTGVPWQW